MNTFIYIYVSICDQTLILYILMYLEIATSNYYFLNRLSSLTRTVLFFFKLLELQIHRNYVSSIDTNPGNEILSKLLRIICRATKKCLLQVSYAFLILPIYTRGTNKSSNRKLFDLKATVSAKFKVRSSREVFI